MNKKVLKKILIPILVLGIFFAPISLVPENRAGNLVAGIVVKMAKAEFSKTLDFRYKKNILLIISHQRHSNVCAGFVLSKKQK